MNQDEIRDDKKAENQSSFFISFRPKYIIVKSNNVSLEQGVSLARDS